MDVSLRNLGAVRRPPAIVAVVTSVVALLAGCSGDEPRHPRALFDWQELSLPAPPGPAGRITVRDAATCAGTWYVVGAVLGPDDASRPAAWRSEDARTWVSIPVAATDYYAQQAILSSVACRDGRIAAMGARSGGAHGNPRISSWYLRNDGTLVAVVAPFVLFGGSTAISVARIAAGPAGWMIAGNRTTGAAVWRSRDATAFRLLDDDPALSSDSTYQTAAVDLVHDGAGWTVIGRAQAPGRVDPLPLAWTSEDGLHWVRQEVPAGTDGYADLERVVRVGDDLIAAGVRDRRFGTWVRSGGQWRVADSFGAFPADSTGARFVSGLATGAGHALVAVSDGARFGLWAATAHTWSEVATPTRPRTSGDAQMTVTADDDAVLLLSDDGTSGRVWRAGWNTLDR